MWARWWSEHLTCNNSFHPHHNSMWPPNEKGNWEWHGSGEYVCKIIHLLSSGAWLWVKSFWVRFSILTKMQHVLWKIPLWETHQRIRLIRGTPTCLLACQKDPDHTGPVLAVITSAVPRTQSYLINMWGRNEWINEQRQAAGLHKESRYSR